MKRFVLFVGCVVIGLRSATAVEVVAASSQAGGLVIVPFAVPVAVPVAVVQQPTLFYGVSAYAPPVATTQAVSTTAATAATAPGSTSPVDDPLRAQVAPLLARRCAECHRGSQSQGSLMLFDGDSRLLDKLPRQLIVEHATSVDDKPPMMPPGDRTPLTSDEQTLVRKWAVLPKRLSY
jgi:uncharacterized membrane protein